MTEAQQGAGSLGGFRQKFGQTSAAGPSPHRRVGHRRRPGHRRAAGRRGPVARAGGRVPADSGARLPQLCRSDLAGLGAAMPSELQQVAQGLVDALDEMPRIVAYLQRTAQKCRENAAYVGGHVNNPAARMAAMQLDEAARRCDEAAHFASLAPQWAWAWAEQMVSGVRTAGPSSTPAGQRPDAPSGGPVTGDHRRAKEAAEPSPDESDSSPRSQSERRAIWTKSRLSTVRS